MDLNKFGIMRGGFDQRRKDTYMGIATIAVIFIISLFASDSTYDFLSRMVIYMLYAEACNIILGFGGLRPLGQGTYFGFSAYAYVFLLVRVGLPNIIALPLALVLTILLAAIFGTLTLKSNDDLVFAFMNMGINILLWTTVQKMQIVGSDTGITGATRFGAFSSSGGNFYFTFVICIICIVAIYLFFHSPFARAIKGTRDNIQRMTFIGYNTRNVRLVAFMISAFFCAIAGLLYSMRNMGAFPAMISNNTSMDALIMCLIGGMYSFFGPILGAIIVTIINVELPNLTQYYQFILGAIICLCVLFLQGGLLKDKAQLNLEDGNVKGDKGGANA